MTKPTPSDEKTRGPAEPDEKPADIETKAAEVNGEAPTSEEAAEEKYRQAGKIASQVREEISTLVKVGARVLDICEAAEARIIELGGGIGFPTNVSINEIAAHYTSPEDDSTIIKDGDIVKLDIGVHIDGHIADTALTFSFNPELAQLVEASREALTRALELVKPKANSADLGKTIEGVIRGYGYRPIRDLSGHQLDEYVLHGPKTLPNISIPHGVTLEEGEAYALETFATTGSGTTHDTGQYLIYSLQPVRVPLRNRGARDIVRLVGREFKSLPFSRRYIAKQIPRISLTLGLRELTTKGVFRQYGVLADTKGSYVSQAEHTFLVAKDGAEITTE